MLREIILQWNKIGYFKAKISAITEKKINQKKINQSVTSKVATFWIWMKFFSTIHEIRSEIAEISSKVLWE
jgi:hypothetical protein